MDIQKDTQNKETLAKFVETQAVRTNPFGDNRVGERAYRRAERLSAAVFILTNHVPDPEILKARTREKSISLMETMLSLRDEMRAINSKRASDLKACVRELISLVRLLAIGGFTSFQNAEVVVDALDELSGFLTASQRSNLSESHTFSRDDLIDVREQSRAQKLRHAHGELSDTSIKDTRNIKDKPEGAEDAEKEDEVRSNNVTVRSQAILEVLRVSGELGIRDIASNLPEYSEKMIQRELVHLVESGKIRKKGLKRWSTYGLIAQ